MSEDKNDLIMKQAILFQRQVYEELQERRRKARQSEADYWNKFYEDLCDEENTMFTRKPTYEKTIKIINWPDNRDQSIPVDERNYNTVIYITNCRRTKIGSITTQKTVSDLSPSTIKRINHILSQCTDYKIVYKHGYSFPLRCEAVWTHDTTRKNENEYIITGKLWQLENGDDDAN